MRRLGVGVGRSDSRSALPIKDQAVASVRTLHQTGRRFLVTLKEKVASPDVYGLGCGVVVGGLAWCGACPELRRSTRLHHEAYRMRAERCSHQ